MLVTFDQSYPFPNSSNLSSSLLSGSFSCVLFLDSLAVAFTTATNWHLVNEFRIF